MALKWRWGRILTAIFLILTVISVVFYLIFGGSADTITEKARKAALLKAQEVEREYKLAKKNGTAADACAQARKAVDLYSNSGEPDKMFEWVKIAQEDCK